MLKVVFAEQVGPNVLSRIHIVGVMMGRQRRRAERRQALPPFRALSRRVNLSTLLFCHGQTIRLQLLSVTLSMVQHRYNLTKT